MEALTSLDISKNKLTRGALKAGEDGAYDHYYEIDMTGMTTLLGFKISSYYTYFVAGIIAVAGAVKDMRALIKLNISNNNIGQGEPLQLISEVCNTKGIELDNHESESDDDDDY
jgi:hypothetical protein